MSSRVQDRYQATLPEWSRHVQNQVEKDHLQGIS